MFTYCTRALRLSEQAATNRTDAQAAARGTIRDMWASWGCPVERGRRAPERRQAQGEAAHHG